MMDFKLTKLSYDLTIVNGKLSTVDSSSEVAQNVQIRLQTYKGEWFLDINLGIPWVQQILGQKNTEIAELLIREGISGTTGVSKIVSFNPLFDYLERKLSIYSTIQTIYGKTETVSTDIGG